MIRVFADTFLYLALYNPKDGAHERACDLAAGSEVAFVTTEFVLIEVADALSAPKDRMKAAGLLRSIRNDSATQILPLSSSLFEEGLRLFSSRADKAWSLTDCTSFVVMEREGLLDAATGDLHFEQAGFHALLKGS